MQTGGWQEITDLQLTDYSSPKSYGAVAVSISRIAISRPAIRLDYLFRCVCCSQSAKPRVFLTVGQRT